MTNARCSARYPFVLRALALCGALAGTACGDDDNGGDVSRFVGNWTITSGTAMATCAPLPVPAINLQNEMLVVGVGPDGNLEATVSGCKVKLNANGDVASAPAGQTCTFNVPYMTANVPAMVKIDSATLSLMGGNATLTLQSTNVVASLPPLSITCSSLNINATASRPGSATPDAGAGG